MLALRRRVPKGQALVRLVCAFCADELDRYYMILMGLRGGTLVNQFRKDVAAGTVIINRMRTVLPPARPAPLQAVDPQRGGLAARRHAPRHVAVTTEVKRDLRNQVVVTAVARID